MKRRFFGDVPSQKSEVELTKEQREQLLQAEVKKLIPHSYAPWLFEKVNEPKFLERMKQMELEIAKSKRIFEAKKYIKNSQFPLLFVLAFAFTYFLWHSVPFTVIFKQFTVSEYTWRSPLKYFYTPFSSAVSLRSKNDVLMYSSVLAYATFRLAAEFSSKMFFFGFLVNSLVSTAAILISEKVDFGKGKDNGAEKNKLMMPKTNSGATVLFFAFSLLGVLPKGRLFGIKFLPYYLICAGLIGLEIPNRYKDDQKCQESRAGHLAGAATGLIFGVAARRMGYTMSLI